MLYILYNVNIGTGAGTFMWDHQDMKARKLVLFFKEK